MKNIIIIIVIIFITIILSPPVYAQSATLSLSPATGTFNKGCAFSLAINLDTGGAQTDGTDAILKYDQSKFTATSIVSGSIYNDYPGNSINDNIGKITVSGLASISSSFSGKGTLATINFKVLDAPITGATKITFDFDPNDKSKTTDSNVVEKGTVADILGSVVDGNYIVGTGSCISPSPSPSPSASALGRQGAVTPGQTATPSATLSPTPSPTLPPGGTSELTFTLAIVGSILAVLGILGLALL